LSEGTTFPWHQEPWRRVSQAHTAGRLPHAILLAGPSGLGKSAFARRLAYSLVCTGQGESGDACGRCSACRQTRAGSHPDLQIVMPEETGKQIRIDAIRGLTEKSVLSVQETGYRVFVIEPADAMNRAAANALLKTLEEPSSRTLLILVSSHPDRLAATIRSRCQMLSFRIPARAEVHSWLAAQIGGSENLDELLAVSGGAPMRALLAREQDWPGQGRRLVEELLQLKNRKVNPVTIVEEWEKRPLPLLSDGLKRCMSDLVKLASGLRDAVIYHPGVRADLQCLSEGIDLQSLHGYNDELLRIERDSSNNLNVQMQLEYMVNRWLQITRPGGR
jgi:DNA polymerase-3 subunit delta'